MSDSKSNLEPAALDVIKLLELSTQQFGSNKFDNNVDFILVELSNQIVSKSLETKKESSDEKEELERLRLMLTIKTNAFIEGTDHADSDLSDLGENLVNNCLLVLHRITDGNDTASTIAVICDILRMSTLILRNEKKRTAILLQILEDCINALGIYIPSSTFDDDSSKVFVESNLIQPLINLKIFETIIDAMIIIERVSNIKSNLQSGPQTHSGNTLPTRTVNLMLGLITNNSDLITAQTLLCVLPKLITLSSCNKLLEKIWTHLINWRIPVSLIDRPNTGKDSGTKVTISRALLILCTLADYFIPDTSDNRKSKNLCFCLENDSTFWKLLQSGLVDSDALLRKQALYLLKRAIDRIRLNNLFVLTENDILLWDPRYTIELTQRWDSIFLVLETLEEKQMHLVTPVFAVVEKVINTQQDGLMSPSLHGSWILCIFQRILKHDNNTIVKWGVLNLIQLDLRFFASNNSVEVIEMLLITLNNSFLFSKNNTSTETSEVVEKLKDFFINLTNLPYEKSCTYFSQIVNVLSLISWDPAALFNVVNALASVSKLQVWNRNDLLVLKSFVTDALGTQSICIRGSIQCQLLQAIIQLADTSKLDLTTVAEVLGSFRKNESLKRGTSSWTNIVHWLSTFVNPEIAVDFVCLSLSNLPNSDGNNVSGKTTIDMKSLARMIILLSDSGLLEKNVQEEISVHEQNAWTTSFQTSFDCLENSETRLYSCEQTQNSVVELIVHLLKELKTIDISRPTQDPPATVTILRLIHNSVNNVFLYITRRLLSMTHLRDFHVIHLYLNALETFSNVPSLYSKVAINVEKLQDAIITCETPNVMDEDFSNSNTEKCNFGTPVQKYTRMRVMGWISKCLESSSVQSSSVMARKQNDFLEGKIQSGKLNGILVRSKADHELTRDLQTLWGRLVSGYLQATWTMFAIYLGGHQKFPPSECFDKLNLYDELLECLEIGGRDVLIDVMKVMEMILSKSKNFEDIEMPLKVVETYWTATFDLRKIDLFWVAMKQFVQMVYQRNVMDKIWMQPHLRKYAEEIFQHGQSVSGLVNILVDRLQEEITTDILPTFLGILVDGMLFGPIHRRDQKVEDETLAFIKRLGKECSINELMTVNGQADNDNKVRVVTVHLLLRLIDNGCSKETSKQLMEMILQRDNEETSRKSRYFGDSKIHRLKHRVMQALLIVETVLNEEDVDQLMAWLCNSLLVENHQPSVRYQQEWLLARILLGHKRLRVNIWEVFRSSAVERPGAMCSFIIVAYLVACGLTDATKQETFIDKTMTMTLPWCMAQHFNVRIYAQVTMKKLWEVSTSKKYKKILDKYSLIISSLQISVDHGNAYKNAQKLQEDFYFNVFDPMRHFSLSTIYHELPRLANLTPNELISTDVFQLCGFKSNKGLVPLKSRDSRLEEQEIAAWILKSTGTGGEEELHENEGNGNIQKKIIPWKAMIPDQSLLLSVSETTLRSKKKCSQDGMIVVASLIDRPPNLGGLCRTCEVFGVSEYVLGHLKYVEDKQFQSLSVSAERWIPITEVKPHLLHNYLSTMKKEGYTLVGAEQTANSRQLNEMKFPKKTLLLLGNEKEGVPANLLPMLDVCVAVPQQGLVRSLNVHVTGAIFIWEYSRQHHL